MNNAVKLTTAEVRSHYVVPLIDEILEKTSLTDHATRLGIKFRATTASDVAPTPTSDFTGGVNTLFQEIATCNPGNYAILNHQQQEHNQENPEGLDQNHKGASDNDRIDAVHGFVNTRCYAEVSVKWTMKQFSFSSLKF